jgi:hypothetical protein
VAVVVVVIVCVPPWYSRFNGVIIIRHC